MNLGLEEKRVLVTGGSRGIGYAIAEQFAQEGASVIIVSRNIDQLKDAAEKLKSGGNERIWYECCDCASSHSLLQLRDLILRKYDGIDIVVANVGDGRSVSDPIPNEEHWRNLWSVNFETSLQTARTFLPVLERANGVLLFISSIAGLEALGAPVDYSTAKSALISFSKNLARKVAEKVRVNVIAPGNVLFPGGSWDVKIKQDPERVEKLISATVPMQRFGTPEEIASAALFLCSDKASFITGSVLVVDGGQTVGIY